jgi:HD superfamily phosphohydrolase YqeK
METDFFTAPASTKYHSNFVGGLAQHSYKVMELLNKKNQLYNLNIPIDSIIICGLLHDICKCNFYVKGKKNVKDGKKPDGRDNWVEKEVWDVDDQLPYGHGSKSVIILQQYINLTEFEIMAILYHMGIPEDYATKMYYSAATAKYPSIVVLSTADIEASYLFEETIK